MDVVLHSELDEKLIMEAPSSEAPVSTIASTGAPAQAAVSVSAQATHAPEPRHAEDGEQHQQDSEHQQQDSEQQHAGDSLGAVLVQVGPRLRHLRQDRGGTLADLAAATGISVSTLSRLESGQRRPSLEVLLPIARAYGVPLDELVADAEVEDPRVRATPTRRGGLTIQPLSKRPGGRQTFRMTVPPSLSTPQQQTHEGHDWLYVLDGQLRLVLAEKDVVLQAGEAAEFDARLPHWFGSTGEASVEFLCVFDPQGERAHLRARARRDQRLD